MKTLIPLWLVIMLVINTSLLTGLIEYYFLKRDFKRAAVNLSQTTSSQDELVEVLKQEVIPYNGYSTSLKWKDLGQQLVEAGVIDQKKFEQLFLNDPNSKDSLKYLEGNWDENIVINENNSRFLVNTLWALGLVNRSKVLDEGPMRDKGIKTGNMASTGGWTLGTKDAMRHYSSREIIKLTAKQEELVQKIAESVYRPCCNNHTAFPDCNHGMAALGYIQLAVKEGLTEEQIYKDLLAFNSYWFPQNYIEMAVYFDKNGTKWNSVDAKLALSKDYSSATGAQRIKQSIEGVEGVQSKGGGCGA